MGEGSCLALDTPPLFCLHLGGGALTLESGQVMYHGHDPIFQASWHSLAYQLTINVPLMCPHFQFLEKKKYFSLLVAKFSVFKMQIFQIFCSQDALFFKENLLRRPYFWKPVFMQHTPTQKS